MISENYKKAIQKIEEHKHLLDTFGEITLDMIEYAEEVLGVSFPEEYRDFMLRYGRADFGSTEIMRIIKKDYKNSGHPDVVWYTMTEREDIGLPSHLVIIYDLGNGEVFCLNWQKLNQYGEPSVTAYEKGEKEEYQTHEVLYESFGNFLLDTVEFEISTKLEDE